MNNTREIKEIGSVMVTDSTAVQVKVRKYPNAFIPTKESSDADGYDVRPCFDKFILKDVAEGDFSLNLNEEERAEKLKELTKYGADVFATVFDDLTYDVSVTLHPGDRILVPTGIFVAIPSGWKILVKPKSGLALKYGISITNTPGTVDADYRGEIGVILENHGKENYTFRCGTKIAQVSIEKSYEINFIETNSLSETDRGEGGFGSTGEK